MSPILASLSLHYFLFSFPPWEIAFDLTYVSLILFSAMSKFLNSSMEFSLEFCIPSYSFIWNLFNLHCLLLEFSLYIYLNSHLIFLNTLFRNLFIFADFHSKIAYVPSYFFTVLDKITKEIFVEITWGSQWKYFVFWICYYWFPRDIISGQS